MPQAFRWHFFIRKWLIPQTVTIPHHWRNGYAAPLIPLEGYAPYFDITKKPKFVDGHKRHWASR